MMRRLLTRLLDNPIGGALLTRIEITNAKSKVRDHWLYKYNPQAGDVIVDIGAGIGWEAVAFSELVGKSGKVLAVEAHPDTYNELQRNIRRSNAKNISMQQKAVSEKSGTVYIGDSDDHLANSISSEPAGGSRSHKVSALSLDDLCHDEGIDRIDFLKLNIEGAEKDAIKGMRKMIGKTNHVCISCHDFCNTEGEEFSTKELIIKFLRQQDFDLYMRDDDPRDYVRDQVHGVRRGLAD